MAKLENNFKWGKSGTNCDITEIATKSGFKYLGKDVWVQRVFGSIAIGEKVTVVKDLIKDVSELVSWNLKGTKFLGSNNFVTYPFAYANMSIILVYENTKNVVSLMSSWNFESKFDGIIYFTKVTK